MIFTHGYSCYPRSKNLRQKILNPLFEINRSYLSRVMATSSSSHAYIHHTAISYTPPKWAERLSKVPKERIILGVLPTPLHKWNIQNLPCGMEVYVKRDDLTEMQMSGNKARKLEFLMAEAKGNDHDCVITIGGIQSNHARATAVASSYLGLPCHLILRTSRQVVDKDPGLVGNLLLDRLSGANIHLVTKEEYGCNGSGKLMDILSERLVSEGKRPFLIPVGGSNATGAWGYLEAIREMENEIRNLGITDIVMACGSGGTASGVALGNRLSGLNVRVHAYGVCDDPAYFYQHVADTCTDLGFPCVYGGAASASSGAEAAHIPSLTQRERNDKPRMTNAEAEEAIPVDVRDLLRCVQARGSGYAVSTTAELRTIMNVAKTTGIVLDPVYNGKAFHMFALEVEQAASEWEGRRVLFLHTGGLLGLFDKSDDLMKHCELKATSKLLP